MIEIKNIKKTFGKKEVLKGIDATFHRGKTNLLIGSSGTGKSVLLKSMVGLIRPDEGVVLYDGKDFTHGKEELRTEIRRDIGMLFQGSALFDSKTVEENIKFPLDVLTTMSKADKLDRVNYCLKRVDMEGINEKMPSEISGGMKKRVGIARAIANDIQYLYCDEPNSGLDPQTSIRIDNLIKEITEELNITTVVVTHDMNSVMEIGDQVIFLSKGEKLWEGNNETIFSADVPQVRDFIFANKLMRAAEKAFK